MACIAYRATQPGETEKPDVHRESIHQAQIEMAAFLLSTKLYIPPLRPNRVLRPRLIQTLDNVLRANHRLTVVSAPAGFGKTTLISEWVHRSEKEIAWVSLDDSDNDPVQFLRYVVAALRQVDGSIGKTLEQALPSLQRLPLQSLGMLLVNDLAVVDAPLILVLDDYHVLTSPEVHQLVHFVIENQPPHMHTVINTRQAPPLPLVQMRARGQITEIHERDLRFTVQETATFLNQTMDLGLDERTVAVLADRTEGWVTGLQLAALALQKTQTATARRAFVDGFAGDDRFVTDYLLSEVLERQPEPTCQFLLQTSILERLSAPLCDAVTGRTDSQAMLEQIERSHLFLTPLDHRREWYRYYSIFAQFLHSHLDATESPDLHLRAMRWYESRGLTGQAIRHALAYGQTGRGWTDAERLIRAAADQTLLSGGITTVSGWLGQLPPGRVRQDSTLATFRGWIQALTGEMALAQEYADAAEQRLASSSNLHPPVSPQRGQLLVLQSFLAVMHHATYARAIDLAKQALQALLPEQDHWRLLALWALAESQERSNRLVDAMATMRQAQRTGRKLETHMFAAVIDAFLANDLNHHGRRAEAIQVCEEAIAYYTDPSDKISPIAGLIVTRLGALHYEANELAQAQDCIDRARVIGESLDFGSPLIVNLGTAAPILHARGETDAAIAMLHDAYVSSAQESLGDAGWLLAWETNIRLQRGEIDFARQWSESERLSLDSEPSFIDMEKHLTFGRVLLAQGQLAKARRWLARLEHFCLGHEFRRWLITVRILQALAADRQGDRDIARDRLTLAVQAAAPQSYRRAFLDEDTRLLSMLSGLRHIAPAFIDSLVECAGSRHPPSHSAPAALVEPLSPRELEVLQLIAAGLANREIAQELFIAVGTVKRHINHIYGKLGVSSRTQAIVRARGLGILI